MISNGYQYEGSSVFVNKLEIKDAKVLEHLEAYFTRLRGADLVMNPVIGIYDFNHLAEIHRRLFSDLYEWAGLKRTVPSAKTNANRSIRSQFADPEKIIDLCRETADIVASKNNLQSLEKHEFVGIISDIQSRYNACHPFPEGNGRATQIMMLQLARNAGFDIQFKDITKQEWANANALAMPHARLYEHGAVAIDTPPDLSTLTNLFDRIVIPRKALVDTDSLAQRSIELFVGG